MHTTPIVITEVLHLVTYVTASDCKRLMSIIDTDYSCYTKAVELVNQSYRVHIMLYHATSYVLIASGVYT